MQILFFILGCMALVSGGSGGLSDAPPAERPLAHRQLLCGGRDLPLGPRRVHRRHPGDRLRRGHHGAVPVCHHAPESPAAGRDSQASLYRAKTGGHHAGRLHRPDHDLRLYPGRRCRRPRRWSRAWATPKSIARSLFTDYLLPFEVTSVLLLVAIVGAVVLAKSRLKVNRSKNRRAFMVVPVNLLSWP